MIGWFALAVMVAGLTFYRFATAPRDGFNNWVLVVFALGLSWNFAEKYSDFMQLDSRPLLVVFFLIPHAIGFFCAFLVAKKLA